MNQENTQVAVFDEKLQNLNKIVEDTKVANDEDLAKISETIKGIKTFKKVVEEEMAKTINPAKEIIAHTKEKYDPYLKALVEAEMALKGKAGVYMDAQEKKRIAEQKKIEEDLEKGKIKKPETAIARLEKLPEQKTTVKTGASSLTMKKIKDIEIIDRNLIPDEYWIVDEVKLKKVALAGVEIPGVKVIEKTSMASR